MKSFDVRRRFSAWLVLASTACATSTADEGSTDASGDAGARGSTDSGSGSDGPSKGADGGDEMDAGDAGSADASVMDTGLADTGVEAGPCGICTNGMVCCTVVNAQFYGKCYSPQCLSCCQ